MYVGTILGTKGMVVQTLSANAKLSDAVATLNAHNIGAVVIVDDGGAIVGILSERDIIRRLGSNAAATLSMSIADCMTRGVVTCTSQTEISEVMERMTARRIRHMPVVDNGKLVGIISIGDVVKHKIEETERDAAALRDYIAS